MEGGSSPEERRALVIAVSEYDEPLESLPFCENENDGKAMYKVLKSLDYQISARNKLIGQVKGDQLEDAIEDFFDDETIRPQDTILFYYSGHGIPDADGDVYLASSESNPKKPYKKGFSFTHLTKMMNKSNSTRIVTILDCCYSGAAEVSKGNEDDAVILGTATIENKSRLLKHGEGKCILSASQAYQEAYGKKKGDHSVFTFYTLQGLRKNKEAVDPDGNVTVDTLGTYVYNTIMNLPANEKPNQKPIRKVEAGGTIVLASYPSLRSFTQDDKSDYNKEITKITEMMGEGKHDKALSTIITSKYYATVPRFRYLEACCRSMVAETSAIKNQENYKKAFIALKNALDNDYIGQMERELGYSTSAAISKIVNDRELDYLKSADLSGFCKSIKITEEEYKEKRKKGSWCLAGSTAIRQTIEITKPISMINIGDSVLIANERGKSAIVQKKFCEKEDWLICINDKITASRSQRFLTTQGFKKAADLKQGDILMSFNKPEPITTINHLHAPTDVYMISLSS
jgi:hypothetical protein